VIRKNKKRFKPEFEILFEPGEIGGCLFKTPMGYCPNMAMWCKYEKVELSKVPSDYCWVFRWNLCAVHMEEDIFKEYL